MLVTAQDVDTGFAIMPFSEEMLEVFILGIRWAASELSVAVERADDLQHNGESSGKFGLRLKHATPL